MEGKVSYLRVLIGFLVLLMAAPPWILAQSSGTGATFRQEELDQMLAPIALYPDSLLGQILVAATYPDQVTEADQWVKQNTNLQGDELNAALDRMNWDLSVKALVPFPQVLSMMSDKRDWTQRMGDAFLAQQADVMDSIQRLRGKAHAQGNLKSTEQQKVTVLGESIEIEPANPQVVYVPTYNPSVIYGSWWYPAYPPYAYNPYYPGYAYDPYYTGVGFVTGGLFGFAAGIAVGSFWHSGWGHWDWGRHNVNVNINRTININRNDIRSGDIRTTSWNRSVRQGRVGSSTNSGLRNTGLQGARTRPTAASVQTGLQQRQSRDQARLGSSNVQGRQTSVGSGRGQTSARGSSGKAISAGRGGSAVSSGSRRNASGGGSAVSSSSRRNASGGGSTLSRSGGGAARSGGGASLSGTPRSGGGGAGGGGGGGHGGGGGGGHGGGGGSHDKHE